MSADVICLSSDEEEEPPKKKRVKLTRVSSNCTKVNESIILSDDDDKDDCNGVEENGKIDVNMTDEKDAETEVAKDPPDNKEEDNEKVDEEEKNVEDPEEDEENIVTEELVENETDKSFREFCAKCRDYIEKLDEKEMLTGRLNVLVKTYAKLKKYDDMEDFNTFFNTQDCGSTPIIAFHSVFTWAAERYKTVKKKREKLDKLLETLNKTLIQLEKKIEKLKSAEVDLDDEEGSSYLKCEAFERRYVQVYKRLCKLQGTDPNEGRITYLPLQFGHSKNSLINKAVNHKYKDSNLLPDFYEFNKFLRKLVAKGGIRMSEEKLTVEIRSCFEHLTNLVKKNRQRELYDVQKHFVGNRPDETLKDSEFNAKIRQGRQKGIENMNAVINKFVELQEAGAESTLSYDSDNSHYEEESV